MERISIADWEKLDLRIGTIKGVKVHPKADKLYVLLIEMGPEQNDRQVVAGIRKFYSEEELLGKRVVLLFNIKPRVVMGVESQAMILAADDGRNPIALLTVDREINDNAKVR